MTRPTSSVRVRRIGYYKETPPIEPVLYDNDRDGIEQNALDVVQNDDVKLDVAHYQQNPDGISKYLQSIPGYTSGEIGAVAATTVVIVFDENVYATNYGTGVTIKTNGATQVIASETRQASKNTVRYVIPAVDANDVVTFAYSATTGLIVSDDDAEPLATITAQTVTNNVAGVVPEFQSAEIGAVDATTLVVTFTQKVLAAENDYLAGVTIKINGSAQVVVSGIRQTNHKVVYYAIPAADANDVVTWEYAKLTGIIVQEDDGSLLGNVTAKTATNTVAGVAPTFVSAEIGTIGAGTIDVTFSVNVFSGNYVTGTSVTINTGSVGIVSGVRQADHKIIRYVLASPAVNGDEVRWSFDTALGGVIVNEADDTFLATITGQVVTNNVA